MTIVDLAGSERTNKTLTAGVRLREASKINTSLMNFRKCIKTLKYNQNVRHDHATYTTEYTDPKT